VEGNHSPLRMRRVGLAAANSFPAFIGRGFLCHFINDKNKRPELAHPASGRK
jgi:hypothetical protein